MQYRQLLEILKKNADEKYREFHSRLLKNDAINVVGVRVPMLRKLAKQFKGDVDNLLAFPDDYYEVVFIKLTAVSNLKYDEFLKYVDLSVSLIDNWASCDCFTPKCIEKHRYDFLPYIEKYLSVDREFYQRFALTTLLHYYVDEEFLDTIFDAIKMANTEKYYYVHMAVSWLMAEVMVKYYEKGIRFLQSETLDKKTHNKAIQKANESFRLSEEQKNYLKGIKR